MISPLVKVVNQTVSQGQENNFGDLTIQLLSVEPINGKAWQNLEPFFACCQ